MEEFDAPDAVRTDFETLRGPGVPAGRFRGVDAPEIRLIDQAEGERLRAELRVPMSAPFFADHFPRRPVFPGTLLLDSLADLALRLAREAAPLRDARHLAAARVTDVKIRSFTPPGQVLEVRVELLSASAEGASLSVAARAEGKSVATARIEVASRRPA
jgi:3-hydroxyacyl-[acyl-carrier-protein] dehydratase